MFGQAPRGGLTTVVYPQQSTTVMGPSEKRRNFLTLPVFEFWKFPTHTKRVPCVCQLTASPLRCPSVFPSAPDMWSKAAVGKMGIYGCFRAISCCPAGNGSMFPPIRANAAPGVRMPYAASAVPTGLGPPVRQRKKLCVAPERSRSTGIDCTRRAKPPSPSPSITRR